MMLDEYNLDAAQPRVQSDLRHVNLRDVMTEKRIVDVQKVFSSVA